MGFLSERISGVGRDIKYGIDAAGGPAARPGPARYRGGRGAAPPHQPVSVGQVRERGAAGDRGAPAVDAQPMIVVARHRVDAQRRRDRLQRGQHRGQRRRILRQVAGDGDEVRRRLRERVYGSVQQRRRAAMGHVHVRQQADTQPVQRGRQRADVDRPAPQLEPAWLDQQRVRGQPRHRARRHGGALQESVPIHARLPGKARADARAQPMASRGRPTGGGSATGWSGMGTTRSRTRAEDRTPGTPAPGCVPAPTK